MRELLNWLVLVTKTVMTRVELGGALYVAAVIGLREVAQERTDVRLHFLLFLRGTCYFL